MGVCGRGRRTALDPAAVHRKPDAAEVGGHVVRDRGGDQNLLRARGHPRQRSTAPVVQLGEHVVEDQHRFDAVRAQQPVGGQPQREGQRPRLAVARVPLRRARAEPQLQIVAVRADEAHPPLDLLAAHLDERGEQQRLQLVRRGGQHTVQRRAVDERDRLRRRRDLRERLDGRRGETRDQVQAPGQQHRTVPGEMAVPHVQGTEVFARGGSGAVAGGLEQRRPLLEHPVVVGAHGREAGTPGDQQVVEEPAPLARVAAHQREVLGGEQHRAQDAQDVPGPGHRRAVHPCPVGPARRDLQFDGQLPALVHDRRADHRPLRAAPDQRGVARDPVRPQRGQVADRLDEVRLPDAVGSDEHADAGLEIELGALPGPEVGDRETAQVHGRSCYDGLGVEPVPELGPAS